MILRLAIIFTNILVDYQATAGFEYERYKVDIPQHTTLIDDPKDYREISFHFLEDFNYCAAQLKFNEEGSVVAPYSDDELINKKNPNKSKQSIAEGIDWIKHEIQPRLKKNNLI